MLILCQEFLYLLFLRDIGWQFAFPWNILSALVSELCGPYKNKMESISSSWWSVLGVHLARLQSLVIQSKSNLRVAVDVIGVHNQLSLRKIIFANLCRPASVSWKALGAKASLKKKKFCLWTTLSSPTQEFQPTFLTSCPADSGLPRPIGLWLEHPFYIVRLSLLVCFLVFPRQFVL